MSTTIEPTAMKVETRRRPLPPRDQLDEIFRIVGLDAIYSGKPAVKDVSMDIYKNLVTAIIGPSGCGKSTFIRCLNRMNDLVPGVKVGGRILYHGVDLYAPDVDAPKARPTARSSAASSATSPARSTGISRDDPQPLDAA